MSLSTRLLRVSGALLLSSCNAVFGLGEGELADGGADAGGNGSGGNGSGAANAGGNGSGADASGGSGGATSTLSSGGGGAGEGGQGGEGGEGGGACVLEVGLENGDFELWGGSNPDGWQKFANNAMVNLSTAMGLTDGLSIGLTDVGANAYGGTRQSGSFIDWNQCVRVSGDAKRSSGMGRLRTVIVFDDDTIDLTLPGGTDFESFSYTCQPTQPLTGFNFQLWVDQVPEGGTVTVQTHGVSFDHVCCEPGVLPCPAGP